MVSAQIQSLFVLEQDDNFKIIFFNNKFVHLKSIFQLIDLTIMIFFFLMRFLYCIEINQKVIIVLLEVIWI